MIRYTKALDCIKAIRKDQQADIKVDAETASFLKTDKERAEKVNENPINLKNLE